MAPPLTWLTEAINDVDHIAQYISADSPAYASVTVAKIISETRRIRAYPNAGRIVPEFKNDRVRERFVFEYRIVYEIREKEILILGIIHGARRFDDQFMDRV